MSTLCSIAIMTRTQTDEIWKALWLSSAQTENGISEGKA